MATWSIASYGRRTAPGHVGTFCRRLVAVSGVVNVADSSVSRRGHPAGGSASIFGFDFDTIGRRSDDGGDAIGRQRRRRTRSVGEAPRGH